MGADPRPARYDRHVAKAEAAVLFDPSAFKGKFVVPQTLVASVFGGRHNPRRRIVWRWWPFLVLDAEPHTLHGTNSTTSHSLELDAEWVIGCVGDPGTAGSYLDPIVLRLRDQVCWDAGSLWFEPFEAFPPRRRVLRLRRRMH
jgi:hypothetical protein